MNRPLRLPAMLLLLALSLVACSNDSDATIATATPATATAVAVVAPTSTPLTPPTSTAVPSSTPVPTAEPTATETPTATPLATAQGDTTGQGDAAGQAGDAAATAAVALAANWQRLMNIAVLNQFLCTALQGLAQTGQQGGLGALAVGASLLGAGGVLQGAQQQLAGLAGLTGVDQLLSSLQANQAAMSDIITRWSGGQLDAAGAAAALQAVCGAADATVTQTEQSAQDAGLSEEEVDGMMTISKTEAAGLLGDLRR